jgi:Family of unknown function (DUF6496)
MPDQETLDRAHADAAEGKAPSTQAGEFVREEIDHVREGKHGARSTKQAIAIGLSKARRAGVKLAPPKKGTTSKATRQRAVSDAAKGRKRTRKPPSARRSRAARAALKREPRAAGTKLALSRQGHAAARKRSAASRSASAKKGARLRRS